MFGSIIHLCVIWNSRIRSVANAVSATNKSLEGNVGDKFPECPLWRQTISLVYLKKEFTAYQTLPRIFVQEAHGNIEGGTAPHLQTVRISKGITSFFGNSNHVSCAKASSEQRLVGVAPGGIHDQNTRIFANGLGEGFWALFDNNIPPPNCAWEGGIERRSFRIAAIDEFGNNDICFEARLALEKTTL